MLDKILRLGKETAIYGLSTILGRLLNFLIVPFYANVLLPGENGVVANLYAYIAFAFVFFCYGMEPAFMRFVASLEIGDKKQNFSVPFLSMAATSVLLAAGIHLNASAIAGLIDVSADQSMLVALAGWILCLDALAVIPFASLRMERKAKLFAGLKVVNIVVTLGMNLVLILGYGMRTEGVFWANLAGSAVTLAALSSVVLRNITLKLPRGLYAQVLKFGIPYLPAGLAGIAMQVVDRPIVKALTDDATLGIYQLNYRLGIFMMLIVGMFDYAWRPFFLSHAKDADAKELFAKVFTYLMIGMMTIFLFVSFFIDDAVRMTVFGKQFFPPAYWTGTVIVPWVLLAYVFLGAHVVFVVGIYLEKKTQYMPLISGAGAALNVAANFILIPRMGIEGAALATLISYAVMAGGMYFVSQRFYRVEYEWGRVLRGVGAGITLFVLWKVMAPVPISSGGLATEATLFLAFPILLSVLRVVDWKEIPGVIRRIGRKGEHFG